MTTGAGSLMLQSFTTFDEVATCDPEDGSLQRYRRTTADGPSLAETSGVFLDDGGDTAMFFRSDGSLILRIGNVSRDLDASGCDARWLKDAEWTILDLMDGEEMVARLRYRPEREVPDDPTPFREAEDGDFGLFVTNVLADAHRRASIFGGG